MLPVLTVSYSAVLFDPPGIARGRADYAFDVLKDSLHAPEASARNDGGFVARLCRLGFIDHRLGRFVTFSLAATELRQATPIIAAINSAPSPECNHNFRITFSSFCFVPVIPIRVSARLKSYMSREAAFR